MYGNDIQNTGQYKRVTHFRNLVARDINGHKYRYMGAAHSMIFFICLIYEHACQLSTIFAKCSTLKSLSQLVSPLGL